MISFIDVKREYEEIKEEISQAIEEVLKNGCFMPGDKAEKIEEKLSEYFSIWYGIAVNSGSKTLYFTLPRSWENL